MAKSEFLAKMSHELKNPLNAIIGYSEILVEDAGGTEAQKCKDLTSIRSAGYRLLGLIDALLELSRLEAGKAELRIEELEFAEFFETMVSLSRPSIAASGNKLIVRPPLAGRMVCDWQKLQRIVEGLSEQCREVYEERSHYVFGFDAGRLMDRIDRGHWGWDRAGANGEPFRDLWQFRRRDREQIRRQSSGSGFLWRIGTAN